MKETFAPVEPRREKKARARETKRRKNPTKRQKKITISQNISEPTWVIASFFFSRSEKTGVLLENT